MGYDIGVSGLRSFFIEKLAAAASTTTHIPPAMAVLRFQLGGLHHHPPAGDQTHFGYGKFAAPIPFPIATCKV